MSARVACFATQGPGSNDEARIVQLLADLEPAVWRFERRRTRAAASLILAGVRDRPDIIVMEGTGLAGGLALMALRVLLRQRYVLSSGDAVGPFYSSRSVIAGPVGALYERLLCRLSAGFVGWTPYLTGRALSFGAPRAMTAPGWPAPGPVDDGRDRTRAELGIPADAIVFGIAGSVNWSTRREYCYGLELVRAIARVRRPDVHVLVVGDGSGMTWLRRAAAVAPDRVHLPGRVPREDVLRHLRAMDVGSLPQSVDKLGAFRYSTKLPEYVGAGLPVATGQLPLAYDLGDGWAWRLPGKAPWTEEYIAGLGALMERVSRAEIDDRRRRLSLLEPAFDRRRQQWAAAAFVRDLVGSSGP
jgi:hypothetical protein